MSSSLAFPSGNTAALRPSKTERTNNPFVPQQPGAANLPFRGHASQAQTLSAFPTDAYLNTAKGIPARNPASPGNAASTPSDMVAPQNDPSSTPGGQISAKPDSTADNKKEKQAVGPIGFVFPVMTLIGTPLMLATSLLGINKTPTKDLEFKPNWLSDKVLGLKKGERGAITYKPTLVARTLFKNVDAKNSTKAAEAIGQKMLTQYKFGRMVLALGIIPKSVIGIMYGVQAQQPSILLAHLLQLPLVGMILKENRTATTLVYLMGGLFTLGFINDTQNGQIKDKLPGSEDERTRLFDMSRFKQVFQRHSGLSFGHRISQGIGEFGKMIKFSAEDHIISSKRALQEVRKLFHGEENELTDLRTTGSISKSSLGFMLSYAATIPALLSAAFIRNEKSELAKFSSRYSMATTLLSGLMLNFGMMLVALNGKNWAERVPMVGTSMELSGTVMGYSPSSIVQPIALALQQLGGGLNSIFFASKAQKD
jgi:hypothetical protein